MAEQEAENRNIATGAQIALVDAFLNMANGDVRSDVIISDATGSSVVARGCWGIVQEWNGKPEHILRLLQDTGVNIPPPPGNMGDHALQGTMHMHVNWHQLHTATVTKSEEGNIKVVFHNDAGVPVLSAFKLRDASVQDTRWGEVQNIVQSHCPKPEQSFEHLESPLLAHWDQKRLLFALFDTEPQSPVLFTGQADRITQITSPRIMVEWQLLREINDGALEDVIRIKGNGCAAEQNSHRQFTGGMPQHQKLHSTHAHVRWADLGQAIVKVGGPNGNEVILSFDKKPDVTGPEGPGLRMFATKGMEAGEVATLRRMAETYNLTR